MSLSINLSFALPQGPLPTSSTLLLVFSLALLWTRPEHLILASLALSPSHTFAASYSWSLSVKILIFAAAFACTSCLSLRPSASKPCRTTCLLLLKALTSIHIHCALRWWVIFYRRMKFMCSWTLSHASHAQQPAYKSKNDSCIAAKSYIRASINFVVGPHQPRPNHVTWHILLCQPIICIPSPLSLSFYPAVRPPFRHLALSHGASLESSSRSLPSHNFPHWWPVLPAAGSSFVLGFITFPDCSMLCV